MAIKIIPLQKVSNALIETMQDINTFYLNHLLTKLPQFIVLQLQVATRIVVAHIRRWWACYFKFSWVSRGKKASPVQLTIYDYCPFSNNWAIFLVRHQRCLIAVNTAFIFLSIQKIFHFWLVVNYLKWHVCESVFCHKFQTTCHSEEVYRTFLRK